jgi:hypothetical protein
MHTHPSLASRFIRGFTTTELMISLGVISLTMAGVVAFTYQALNVYAYDSGRLLVNHDMRKFTGDMITDSVYSNYFRIYSDFSTTARAACKTDGQTGDFLVLVFADTNTSGVTTINRLIGYYRDPDASGVGPVRRFDATVNPAAIIGSPTNTGASPPVYTMPDLLSVYAPTANAHSNNIVIQLAQGLASGNLFYDFYDRSIMIRGQINEQGSMIRRAVNTYNFTVSPRG